jgi:hypothetical protein
LEYRTAGGWILRTVSEEVAFEKGPVQVQPVSDPGRKDSFQRDGAIVRRTVPQVRRHGGFASGINLY